MASPARKLAKSVHSTDQKAFCALMIAARKSAGLSQETLANRLARPQSFVAKYEGGERRIDVIEFLGIAEAIGTDPFRILRRLKLRPRRS
jgi:transcriptional regulator with XRE-family HTH domain